MVFEKFQTRNNIKWLLDAGMSTITDTMIIQLKYKDLFPPHNWTTDRDYLLTIEALSDTFDVLKREIVRVIAKVDNVFTIVRSAWYCPASYIAETYTNTAFSFLSWDVVSLNIVAEDNEDMKTELTRLETDKADDDTVVHLAGEETIDDVKTFTSIPVLPLTLPTLQEQAANKEYVDQMSADSWFTAISDTVYLNWFLQSFTGDWLPYVLTWNASWQFVWLTNGINSWTITYDALWNLTGTALVI